MSLLIKLRVLTTLTALGCFIHAAGQINRDSLYKVINDAGSDTDKVKALNLLSNIYSQTKPDSALRLGNEAVKLSREKNFLLGEAAAYSSLGNAYATIGNYARCLEMYLKSQRIYEQLNDSVRLAGIYGVVANAHYYQGNYQQNIAYTNRALRIFKGLNQLPRYYAQISNLGDTYEKMNLLDSAYYYTTLSYHNTPANGNAQNWALRNGNMGNVYRKLGKYDSAIHFYHISLPLYLQTEFQIGICEVALGLAEIYKAKGQKDSTLYYAKMALNASNNGEFLSEYVQSTGFLANYYKILDQTDSSYKYLQKNVAAKDSLFSSQRTNEFQNLVYSEMQREQDIRDAEVKAQNKIRQNLMLLGLAAIAIIAILLLRNIWIRRKSYRRLELQKERTESLRIKAEQALNDLQATQAQLIQSEKMASLGELTAGIAHEIQNPLNFVNNFSEVNEELVEELHQEIDAGNHDEVRSIANDLKENSQKINHHGKRADAIVKSMLQHSRRGSGQKELTNINKLADEYLRLSYHGLRAKDKTFNADYVAELDESLPMVEVFPQDLGRVVLNLLNNAFYAVALRARSEPEANGYKPTVIIKTKRAGENVHIIVEDNGGGIPHEVQEKIFQPFYTTKPAGSGTGLGLSLSYDIIKAHNGSIDMKTAEGRGTSFIIAIPLHQNPLS